jgi:hypothetical protein
MWIETKMDYFKIEREERLVLNHKLEEQYKAYGKYFEVLNNSPFFMDNRAMAYMEVNQITLEVSFACGTFWYEEDNLCPVVAMTHELGHYIDLSENFGGRYNEYNRTLGTLELEVRAWEYGIKICEKLGLVERYKDMIFQYAHKCLGSYFNGWGIGRRDHAFGFNGRRLSFEEAIQRIQQALGMEITPQPKPEPRDPFLESLARLEELLGGGRRTAQFNPCEETEELTPLERVRKQKEKYRETVKKGMNVKPWEL